MSNAAKSFYRIEYVHTVEHKIDFPLVFYFDGSLSYELLAFLDHEYKNNRGQMSSSTRNVVMTVAELHYFYSMQEDTTKYDENPYLLVYDYSHSRMTDYMFWGDVSTLQSAKRRVRSLRQLQDCVNVLWNSKASVSDGVLKGAIRSSYGKKANNRLLAHLDGVFRALNDGDAPVHTTSFGVSHRTNGSNMFSYFPPADIIPFINAEKDPNQKAAYILQAFGSMRGSEWAHLLENDFVILRDSSEFIFPCPEKKTRDMVSGRPITRADVFKEVNRVNPTKLVDGSHTKPERKKINFLNRVGERTMEPSGYIMFAGFKGVTLKTMIPNVGNVIEFTNDDAKRALTKIVMNELIPQKRVRNHPFMICDKEGYPLSLETYSKRLYRATLKWFGHPYPPHTLRHFSGGYLANNLKVPVNKAQIYMRHAAETSTQIYYHITSDNVRSAISTRAYDDDFLKVKAEDLKC